MSKLERDVVGMLAIKARDLLTRASALIELPALDWKQDVHQWFKDLIHIETATADSATVGAKTDRSSCGGCRHFHRYPPPKENGECHRYPPPGDDGWPLVNEKDWCSEFQKKEATT